jgi:serine/threonine-protein kinase
MSPEQTRGEALDRRSDIFSLGIVLYELATCRRLFQRGGFAKALHAINTEPIVPPSRVADGIPPRLEEICLRALAKDRDERYATAAEMRQDLLDLSREVKAPTETLASTMRELFADRLLEKEEMLRRVRQGAPLTHIPMSEVDTEIVVPNVTEVFSPTSEGRQWKSRARMSAALGALGALVAVLVGLLLRARAHTVAERATAEAQGSASATPTVRAEIVVHIETTPSGANVRVGGSPQGESPIDLHLARGDEPVAIELERRGYQVVSQAVVPDADQKLILALQPLSGPAPPARPRPAGRPAARSAPAASSGFRRFD